MREEWYQKEGAFFPIAVNVGCGAIGRPFAQEHNVDIAIRAGPKAEANNLIPQMNMGRGAIIKGCGHGKQDGLYGKGTG